MHKMYNFIFNFILKFDSLYKIYNFMQRIFTSVRIDSIQFRFLQGNYFKNEPCSCFNLCKRFMWNYCKIMY